jgi:hypothetical protein
MLGLKARGAGRRPITAGGARGPARLTRLKVGDGPDSRVPPVSGRSERKGREGCAGPVCVRSWAKWAGARAREKEKGLRPARLRAERGERERVRERKGFAFFLKFLSNSLFKLQSNKIHAFKS